MTLANKDIAVDLIDKVESLSREDSKVVHNAVDPSPLQQRSKQEQRLLLKQDLAITLVLSGCYFWAYLDRGNIRNARVMGFQKDLRLSDRQFFNTLMMFYVGYMVFELPAALSLRFLHPGWAYGSAVMAFGVFSTCLSSVHSYGGVLGLRLLLGCAEAYLQTGLVYLALWYKPGEMGTRNAIFYGLAPFAGMISGLIAYGCEKNLNGVAGFTAWQWLYIVEGVPTVAWGILTAFCVPTLPEKLPTKGHWLFRSKTEQILIMSRMEQGQNSPHAKPVWWQLWWAIKDPKTYLGAFGIVASVLNIVVLGNLLPTFIKAFGFSPLDTQLYVMIPYAFATVLSPVAGLISDRVHCRTIPLCACISVSIVGYVILLSTTLPTALVAGCCFVASGAYSGLVLSATFIVVNHAGYTKRASALAIAQILAQLCSIMSTQIYTHPPHFYLGHGIILGFNVVGLLCVVVMYIIMSRANRQREMTLAEGMGRGDIPGSDASFEDLCDYHPQFRYSV
ncbi:hypothetical protein M409DRAFT_71412 [Zasmidium cellare ATCC 36951]|uniref:Major facilitator superfamily (MFS) profile domain-containing protein n=1 Tax=Zasmidium cellare ATCC 36951 TaxID=1080233 RepID=A0A6A6BVP8_ZASCE|nr:uncharacterized protein M409DRAFT_71412 [Zasmidium cellare ATCC 36951]KAF2158851.1 hypothetical protein M409DRAFT_71412 [Zasmidium cellare ATCC 36951]